MARYRIKQAGDDWYHVEVWRWWFPLWRYVTSDRYGAALAQASILAHPNIEYIQ